LYADTEKHYLDEPHQLLVGQCLHKLLQYASDEKIASQKQINQKYHERLMTDLRQIGAELLNIDQIRAESVSIATTQNNMKMSLMDIREQLVRMHEVFGNPQVISDIDEIIVEINQLFAVPELSCAFEIRLMGPDDVFTWKFDSVRLLSDDLPTLDSGPFQSSRWGYRMKIGISIKKDEKTKVRCVLFAFTLVRGEYDPILSWPFSYPISFCIVDLAGTKKHIVKSVVPDSQDAMFGRPCSDTNKPYFIDGVCQFDALIDTQSRYIRDQSMFLKFHIDFINYGIHPF
jgi:hypothetical protein